MPSEEFRYWDLSSWKEYIKKYVGNLHQSSRVLLELHQQLQDKIKEVNKGLINLMLGGILPDGTYDKYSSGKLIRRLFGLYIDPHYWVSISSLKDIALDTKIEVLREDSEFLEFLKEVNELSEKILRKAEMRPSENSETKVNIEEIINTPEKLLDLIEDFLKSIMGFVANYNRYTFFVISINHLPRFLIELLYPKLKSTFNDISSFLGLSIWERFKEECKELTLYGFDKESIGGLIYSLNDLIWDKFNEEKIKDVWEYVLEDAPELKKEYYSNIKQAIIETQNHVVFPEIPSRVGDPTHVMCKLCMNENRDIEYAYSFQYEIKGCTIKHIFHRARYYSKSYLDVEHNVRIDLKAFFIDVAPFLATKILDICFQDKKLLTIWR